MPGTPNQHVAQLWRLHDHVAADGIITPAEQCLLNHQEAICQAMDAALGLARAGAPPRDLIRRRPDLAARGLVPASPGEMSAAGH